MCSVSIESVVAFCPLVDQRGIYREHSEIVLSEFHLSGGRIDPVLPVLVVW